MSWQLSLQAAQQKQRCSKEPSVQQPMQQHHSLLWSPQMCLHLQQSAALTAAAAAAAAAALPPMQQ
jgi:hypothetical protein